MQSTISTTPFVVAREQIPAATNADEPVQARPFAGHELMAQIASPGAQLCWLEARAGQEVPLRSHAGPSLLLILRGRASLVGAGEQAIEQGDVLTLPSGQKYGFSNIDVDLHVLHVALPHGPAIESDDPALSLERLLERHRQRAREILETPGYMVLRNGSLNTAHRRSTACEALRVFSDAFQTFLFTRQAMCRDKAYLSIFHGHLLEELGHNDLLKVSRRRRILADPILRAASSWFSHQMLTLDNAGKTVVNLVLETSGYHFHTLAKPVFASAEAGDYFDVHAEADEEHMTLGVDLLAHLHPDVYRRLLDILEDSWNMLETVTNRFAELVDLETSDESCAAQ
jgi:hypothetical protein